MLVALSYHSAALMRSSSRYDVWRWRLKRPSRRVRLP